MSRPFDIEKIYRQLPARLQDIVVSVEGWRIKRVRYGGSYERIEIEVARRWSMDRSQLQAFQAERLQRHFAAAAGCPFWRERFAAAGVRVKGSDPFAELAKLPVLRKDEIRERTAEMMNSALPPSRRRPVHSSGTTGGGLIFAETPEAEWERWAVWWRYRWEFGLNRELFHGYFGGRSIVPLTQTRPPFWRQNRPGRQLLMSAYHLSEATVGSYWKALERREIEWLHGYPSFLTLFAELARSANLPPLRRIKWITTGAENLLASQRQSIESVFGVPVHQHYGMAESVANFSERRDGAMRVDEDFSFVEFVPLEGGEENQYHIVGTNWTNPAFPLFRYDSGDVATASREGLSEVWRRVETVDGRQEDFVILQSGARVGRLDHIFKDLVHIREAQVRQRNYGELIFNVVKGNGYEEAGEEQRLLAEARIRLGSDIRIRIEYVDSIPRTKTGKLRFVVSDIPVGKLGHTVESPSVK
jgi:phenylacetate-CoA ligase